MGGGEGFDRIDEFVSCWRSAIAECVSNETYHRLRLDLLSFAMVGCLCLSSVIARLGPTWAWLIVLGLGSCVAVILMLIQLWILLLRDMAMIDREQMFSDLIGLR
jgi:hypothetical protein